MYDFSSQKIRHKKRSRGFIIRYQKKGAQETEHHMYHISNKLGTGSAAEDLTYVIKKWAQEAQQNIPHF